MSGLKDVRKSPDWDQAVGILGDLADCGRVVEFEVTIERLGIALQASLEATHR
jgi:hypothetical protein